MLLLGHRGASADAPENTLSAFQEAVAQGADGVELDARLCGSGEVVVCHDAWLDRLAGVRLEVRRTPFWKLKTVDVGTQLGFARERIPSLEEVLDALPAPLCINIELKSEHLQDTSLAERVGQLVLDKGCADRVVVSSFQPLCLLRLGAAFPALRRGFLIDPERPFFVQRALLTPLTSNYSVHPHFTQCTPARMKSWRAAGLQVAAWTVDQPGEASRLRALGAAYCITNRPGALRRALEQG